LVLIWRAADAEHDMPPTKWIRANQLSRDEFELYFGSLAIMALAMVLTSLQ
jgi:hypothetical protein